jgi:predicted permease
MNALLRVLYFFIDVLLPLLFGNLLRKKITTEKNYFDGMMQWNIFTLVPFLNLLSFWIIRPESGYFWLPVLGVAMQLVPGAAGFFHGRKKYSSPLDQGSYVLSAMLANRGIVGMISVFILYGEEGYAIVRLVMLFASLVLYLLCYPLARSFYHAYGSGGGAKGKMRAGSLLFHRYQVPVLGIMVGLLLKFLKISRPFYFTTVFSVCMHISIWLFILPLGFSLDLKKAGAYLKGLRDILVIKFIITPIVSYFLALAVGLDGIPLRSVLILSSTPTAVNAVIASKIHKLNFHLAMSAYILTTAVYIFLIYPIILLLFEVLPF